MTRSRMTWGRSTGVWCGVGCVTICLAAISAEPGGAREDLPPLLLYETGTLHGVVTDSVDAAPIYRAFVLCAGRGTVTDAASRVTTYAYDVRDREISTTYDDTSTEQKLYGTGSSAGQLIATKDRNGAVTKYCSYTIQFIEILKSLLS